MSELILASASPRRRKILEEIGVPFRVVPPEVDEVFWPNRPRRTAEFNALRKHAWARERLPHAAILAADTVIDFDGRCVAKPDSHGAAATMLRAFSGHAHRVLTAVAWSAPESRTELRTVESVVRFRRLSEADIEEYLRAVNPLDKAGAYDIDQRGDLIVESFEGSWTNVMGLPRETVEPWVRSPSNDGGRRRPARR
jgi:septum formation protein